MFGNKYFGPKYFGDAYFGSANDNVQAGSLAGAISCQSTATGTLTGRRIGGTVRSLTERRRQDDLRLQIEEDDAVMTSIIMFLLSDNHEDRKWVA